MTLRNDLTLYERNASTWWSPNSKVFRSLRALCALDLELIREAWGPQLAGARVADLGCGGGFMTLGLAELGANVTGIDISAGSLEAAREQARLCGLSARFVRADLTDCPLGSAAFDFVLLHDVLEHVEEPRLAVLEAARLLQPGGGLYVSTIDSGFLSKVQVLWLGEGLGFIPRGTHDARLFVSPARLAGFARDAGLKLERTIRRRPALLATLREWTIRLRVAESGPTYAALLVKESS